MTTSSPNLEDHNDWADFWRYKIGVNVIPADTPNKRTYEKWSEWQDKAIPEQVHNEWKANNVFSKGMAIIVGKVWHRPDKKGCYLASIDADNETAIKEICTKNNKKMTLNEFASKTLVEQHRDNLNKAHLYFYAPRPVRKKSSDISVTSTMTPAIEVKGEGKHGVMFCTPSHHMNGHRYQIDGTCEPLTLTLEQTDDLEKHIDDICRKYSLKYLEEGNGSSSPPIQELFKTNTQILEGHNRHEALLRAMESLISRNTDVLSSEQIKQLSMEWNAQHCVPPLDHKEFEKQWQCAIRFIATHRTTTIPRDSDPGTTDEKEDDKKAQYLQRYSNANERILAEAVLIGGLPKFLVSVKGEVSIRDRVHLDDKIVKPFEASSYINRPYSFTSEAQLNECIHKARNENLESLYKKVKSIWKKYVDADDFHISICAADSIFTYYQDRLGLTHYLFFVGNNNSGKSNNLHVLHWLGYRNMMSTDVTSANIYQFLGSGEEGVGTICEDEADNIDDDRDKMRIYKNGYTTGNPVLRTDTSYGRKQYKYNTFCFKAFAAERLPDTVKAKGFNQRIIELPCTYGFPQYDISEVINPAGEEEYECLLGELNDIRNNLLIFRLAHFHEKIPDIRLNIQNREKQLFKPVLRIFQDKETLNEFLPIISKYVNQKRESNANTLHAFLYHLIMDLVKIQGSWELESNVIWSQIKRVLEGNDLPNRPQSYDSVDYGIMSQKEITEILMDVFGGVKPKSHKHARSLIFNPDKLEKLGRNYDLEVDIQVIEAGGTHRTHGTLVGLDKHILEGPINEESVEIEGYIENNYNKNSGNSEEIAREEMQDTSTDSQEVSYVSQASPSTDLEDNNATDKNTTANRVEIEPTLADRVEKSADNLKTTKSSTSSLEDVPIETWNNQPISEADK